MGPIPPTPFYTPNGMSPKDREAFMAWHESMRDRNYIFDFQEEIVDYCRSDVDILRRCCMEFRELFYNITDIDAFTTLTIAAACHKVYRTNYLAKDTIAVFPPMGYAPKNKHSLLAQKWLMYTAEKEEIDIQHARNGGEKRVGDYFLDGYHEETHTAYEVEGCFWHGCPRCYTGNSVTGKTMHEHYQSTMKKIEYLKREGYNVVEVWECDIQREMNENMKHYFEYYPIADPLEPRDALYGGRNNASKLFHRCEGEEQIKYVDFTSLYPHVNRSKTVPIGHPEIITENFEEDVFSYFGLIKCTVLPPRGLFHPVLPYRTQGKLMFALCKTCADTCNQTPCNHSDAERAIQGTWCTVELMKALEKGYRLLQIHEVWHFPQKSDTLFKDYMDTFAKIKLEASGYPKNCVTEEQKQAYVNDILENQGIQLDPGKIAYNPGLRALAKLMLNSFWGKFAQSSNLVKTEQIDDPQKFFDYLTSDEIIVLDAHLVSEEILEIRYEFGEKFVQADPKTNVVIAAFTTAYARFQLYDELDMLGERVLYYDTDSVIYLTQPGQPEPQLGNYIGDLTDELGGEYITVFASGGPKNYGYKTNGGKTEVKVRGITLDCSARQKVNFESMCALVFLRAECNVTGHVSVDIPFRITRNTRTKEIQSKRMKKDHCIVYNKRVITQDYKTLPYGY